jgi:hypothetical protein
MMLLLIFSKPTHVWRTTNSMDFISPMRMSGSPKCDLIPLRAGYGAAAIRHRAGLGVHAAGPLAARATLNRPPT